MKNSSTTRFLLAVVLVGAATVHATSQQPAPVPITSDTPAATARPMPPETTPVQASGPASSMSKGQLKSQRKQQKAEEKAATSNAKAAKANAKAKKQTDKAVQDQEKAVKPPNNQ